MSAFSTVRVVLLVLAYVRPNALGEIRGSSSLKWLRTTLSTSRALFAGLSSPHALAC